MAGFAVTTEGTATMRSTLPFILLALISREYITEYRLWKYGITI
jgi:hypothetical protein